MKALITRKVGMTSTIADDGVVTAVTLLSASPCVITQVKTADPDGYTAVQIGFEEAKKQNVNKAQQGHFAKAGDSIMPKILREFRVDEITEDLKVGETISMFLKLGTLFLSPAPAKVKAGQARSSATTSTAVARPTAAAHTAVLVPSVPCTRRKFSRVRKWPAKWATNRLLSAA